MREHVFECLMHMRKADRVNHKLRLECLDLREIHKSRHTEEVFEFSSIRVIDRYFVVQTELLHKPGSHMAGTHHKYLHSTILSL